MGLTVANAMSSPAQPSPAPAMAKGTSRFCAASGGAHGLRSHDPGEVRCFSGPRWDGLGPGIIPKWHDNSGQ